MVDDKVPPPDSPESLPVDPSRPPFTSPYGMYPDVDAARDALAAAAAEKGNTLDVPTQYAFDATKPTIDQTRSAAIDSIRNNFVALQPASGYDPSVYLPKTGGIATDLTINHPTVASNLLINSPVGQVAQIVFQQTGAGNRFSWRQNSDNLSMSLLTMGDDAVWKFSFNMDRRTGNGMFGYRLGVGGTYPRTVATGPVTLDVTGAGYNVGLVVQELSGGYGAKLIAVPGTGIYLDAMYADANGALLGSSIPLMFRTQNPVGAMTTRLKLDPYGAIKATDGAAAFVGSMYVYGTATTFNGLDFRVSQAYQIVAGSVINSVVMALGQVGRIYVWGGSITLPTANWFNQQGGPVWGPTATIISLWTPDGVNVFATFAPF